jgi:hypothetical protein
MPGLREKRGQTSGAVSPHFRGLSPFPSCRTDPASPLLRKKREERDPLRALGMTALLPSRHSELDSESRFSKEWIRVGARDDRMGALKSEIRIGDYGMTVIPVMPDTDPASPLLRKSGRTRSRLRAQRDDSAGALRNDSPFPSCRTPIRHLRSFERRKNEIPYVKNEVPFRIPE